MTFHAIDLFLEFVRIGPIVVPFTDCLISDILFPFGQIFKFLIMQSFLVVILGLVLKRRHDPM